MSNAETAAWEDVPPFEEMFRWRLNQGCIAREFLTPRNAAHLWVAATRLAFLLDEQINDVRSGIPLIHSEFGRLPWVVYPYPDWCGRFIDTVVSLGDDLASGRCPVPRCTGEEVALHLLLEDVVEFAELDLGDRLAEVCPGLPAAEWDGEWDGVALGLFPDRRVRLLIADNFGGITDDYELVAETGLVRLAVEHWFEPYDASFPVRPLPMCECTDRP